MFSSLSPVTQLDGPFNGTEALILNKKIFMSL